MGRLVVAVVVVLVEVVWLLPDRSDLPPWVVFLYAAAVGLVMAIRSRFPAPAFAAAMALASVSGGSFALLVCASYEAGHRIVSRWGAIVVAAGSLAYLAVQLPAGGERNTAAALTAAFVVLVALPMVVGRYLAQHRRLVAALDRHNRQLRWERELLAERERLRERLRIARDMHDSLGHRLGLVSVQAAALEVTRLPEQQRQAVTRLAGAAREAMDELHELVGALRQPDESVEATPGVEGIGDLVDEFRAAGSPVTLRYRGEARPLPVAAGQAAYRVVEEGLTNAAKHALKEPVEVSVEWEPDALLLGVSNGLAAGTAVAEGRPGHGLAGLAERVRLAGGLLRTDRSATGFRLVAMLPAVAEPAPARSPAVARMRVAALVLSAAALIMLTGPAGAWGGS
ncbi:sensor histidine kinase [Actinomadura sp. HBU206391]|uniref:sensor histidine kinase n=1 Tax=Actinomadura sp. HBU206391 TaxID=2731692 RepID=UPI00164FA3DA|nr:histidine kinase [Actinomadura sp. HBU206391]MBC6461819.1 hypothetical protein [Actinomadura sp. HBU206391]